MSDRAGNLQTNTAAERGGVEMLTLDVYNILRTNYTRVSYNSQITDGEPNLT